MPYYSLSAFALCCAGEAGKETPLWAADTHIVAWNCKLIQRNSATEIVLLIEWFYGTSCYLLWKEEQKRPDIFLFQENACTWYLKCFICEQLRIEFLWASMRTKVIQIFKMNKYKRKGREGGWSKHICKNSRFFFFNFCSVLLLCSPILSLPVLSFLSLWSLSFH